MLLPNHSKPPTSRHCLSSSLVITLMLSITAGLICGNAFAQSASSTVAGVVHDQLGGVLPNVKVGLARASDQRSRLSEAFTSQDGAFKFGNLPAGEYVLEASRPGAQAVQQKITLGGKQQVVQDITVKLLAIEEQITVTSNPIEDQQRQPTTTAGGRRDCLKTTSGLEPVVLIARQTPQYPAQLRNSGSEGNVILAGRIATDGSMTALRDCGSQQVGVCADLYE